MRENAWRRPMADAEILQQTINQLLSACDSEVAVSISSEDVEHVDGEVAFVGASPTMRKLRAQIESLSETDNAVLITGETGSGKETVARLIHQLSIRSGFSFAKVNCAALPSDLLEVELFGYDRKGSGLSQLKSRQTRALRQRNDSARRSHRDAVRSAEEAGRTHADQAILPAWQRDFGFRQCSNSDGQHQQS